MLRLDSYISGRYCHYMHVHKEVHRLCCVLCDLKYANGCQRTNNKTLQVDG